MEEQRWVTGRQVMEYFGMLYGIGPGNVSIWIRQHGDARPHSACISTGLLVGSDIEVQYMKNGTIHNRWSKVPACS